MKKSLVFVGLFLVLGLSVFVSAGFFDFWKTTGKVIDAENPCEDTDGGNFPETAGSIYWFWEGDNSTQQSKDYCSRQQYDNSAKEVDSCEGDGCFITEYTCTGEGGSTLCANGCNSGACDGTKTNNLECIDPDEGELDYAEKTSIWGVEDTCITDFYLLESTCRFMPESDGSVMQLESNSYVRQKTYECKESCIDGVCVGGLATGDEVTTPNLITYYVEAEVQPRNFVSDEVWGSYIKAGDIIKGTFVYDLETREKPSSGSESQIATFAKYLIEESPSGIFLEMGNGLKFETNPGETYVTVGVTDNYLTIYANGEVYEDGFSIISENNIFEDSLNILSEPYLGGMGSIRISLRDQSGTSFQGLDIPSNLKSIDQWKILIDGHHNSQFQIIVNGDITINAKVTLITSEIPESLTEPTTNESPTENTTTIQVTTTEVSTAPLEISETISLPNLYWADSNGNRIGNEVRKLAAVGDTVYLVIKQTGLSENETLLMEIWEDDVFFDDKVRVEEANKAINGIVDAQEGINAPWTITQEDYDSSFDKEEFVFIVNSEKSDRLTIFSSALG